MAFRSFLDANLLLDFTLKRAGFDDAEAVVQKGLDGEVFLFTTPAVVHIVSYWLRKAYGSARTKEIILSLFDVVTVIDCDHPTALLALYSNMTDVEDALQYFAALKHGLTHFISSDKGLKAAAVPQLPVMVAKDFLAMLTP